MQCPIDGEVLVMTHRNGVEIDYCPKCRGVWLDRGELDKILEQAGGPAPSPAAPVELREPRRAAPAEPQRYRHDDDDDDDDYRGRGRRPKRRESFLSELFDF